MWKVAFLLVFCSIGFSCSKKEADEQIVVGYINVLVKNAQNILLLTSEKQDIEIYISADTQYTGVSVENGSVLWDLGHHYQITGSIIDNNTKKTNPLYEKAVIAGYIKYLGPPPYDANQSLEKEIVSNSKDKVIEAIDKGADFKRKLDGGSLLHYAAKWGSGDIVELLINKGLDVNAKDDQENTPLHIAVENCKLGGIYKFEAKIEKLLDSGADAKLKNIKGQTPWKIANSVQGDKFCREILKSFDVVFE